MKPAINIADELHHAAQKHPKTAAVITPCGRDHRGKRRYTIDRFDELEARSRAMAIALQRFGITQGMRCVLMMQPGVDLFALTFGLFKLGAVPVLIDPGMGVKNLKACIEEAEPEAFIGMCKAQLARIVYGWGEDSLRIIISSGHRYLWGGYSLPQALKQVHAKSTLQVADVKAEDVAAILFTSGSTGSPKGVVYTHANFMAQLTVLRQCYDIRPGDVDLPTFPLFALFAPALGMTAVIPEMDFTRPGNVNPRHLIELIEDFSVNSMFGSPALIRRLADYGETHDVKLTALRRVISAGAPVPFDVLARFVPMLNEDCQVYTPYGATEALPICSIDHHSILEETAARTAQGYGVCVGQPVDGVSLKIIAINDEPIAQWSDDLALAQGEIGEIVVKAAQVTQSYYQRPSATAQAKITDGEGFWHRMGDIGWQDDEGRVWFCGRKSQRIQLQEQTLFTIPCEAIFNAHHRVFRSALVSVQREGRVLPVICVQLHHEADALEQANIRNELLLRAAAHSLTSAIDIVLFHPAFPVDIRHNAKIFREQLACWADEVIAK